MVTFRTRARTLEMLGRQQIAGIPTAISELFKNAHDAYADHVEIDYFRSDGLFVLRDDGVGMSKEDFENRWLTIGTESKFDPKIRPPQFADKPIRPMLGEKGIGRLAIAIIGPQLLVLTRAVDSSDLVVVFLNWGIFEWPGIDLEEIIIPSRIFPGGTLPTGQEVSEMIDEFRSNAEKVGKKVDTELVIKIKEELDQFDIDPIQIDSHLSAISTLSLNHFRSGTHFIIKPANPLLKDDIDGEITQDKAPPLQRALLGFSNTMIPKSDSPIKTGFRDHKTEEYFDDLISDDEFFTPEEFENADHQIRGEFDKFGQFIGEISIYGEILNNHVIPWKGSYGVPTECGPFRINFAHFERENRHSTIPPEEHARLSEKAKIIGGLYVYRNGIRILPYGNTDFDWLDIELNRTKGAGYYYFSHRKMFGTIEIDIEKNKKLVEKAGREGFQENKAYRQFRSILRNFLLQLLIDFFRDDSIHTERLIKKEELKKEELAKRKREKFAREKKIKFGTELNEFFKNIENKKPQEEAKCILKNVETGVRLALEESDTHLSAEKILIIEKQIRQDLRNLENSYRITRPRIGFNKQQLRDWEDYNTEFTYLQNNVFIPTRKMVDELIEDKTEKASLVLKRQIRTEVVFEDLEKEVQRITRESGKDVRIKAEEVASEAKEVASQALKEVEKELRDVLSEIQRKEMNLEAIPEEDFVEKRNSWESRVLKVTEEQGNLLRSIQEQLESIDVSGESTTLEQLGAIEQRNIMLEEQAETDAQLTQLGMAIEIIDHEFSATIRSIRTSLRKLKAWADINQGLEGLYNNIRTSFDHLDGYLTLFTPLQRRLYRKKVLIEGFRISDFLKELFKARMERHGISLVTTKAFSKATIIGFPSSFYPVFVNLTDNAIYWLAQQNPSLNREIILDEQNGMLIISDTGPGVTYRDRDSIFELGFSRKPGGRGMGLHIGRETLRRVGYDLILLDSQEGASFGLVPMGDEQENK
ncbi:MAG: ATP-binding protein [Paracoccaceae bacterium]|nr:ATP-binding protein [Paracoccaceae bacterium]MDE2674889.1 ATP-binding protein [Paracoccaceae bacterium]